MKNVFLCSIALVTAASSVHATVRDDINKDLKDVMVSVALVQADAKNLKTFNEMNTVCGKGKNNKESLKPEYVAILESIIEKSDDATDFLHPLLTNLNQRNFCVQPVDTASIESLWKTVKTALDAVKDLTESLETKKINKKTVDRCIKGEVQKDSKTMIAGMAKNAADAAKKFESAMNRLKTGQDKAWCVK